MAETTVEILVDQHNRVLDYTDIGDVRDLSSHLQVHPGSRILIAATRPSGLQGGYGYNPETNTMIARSQSDLHLPYETVHTRWDELTEWGREEQAKLANLNAFPTGLTSRRLSSIFYGFIYNTLLIFHNPANRLDNVCWAMCVRPTFEDFQLLVDYSILEDLTAIATSGQFLNPSRVYLWRDNAIVLVRPTDDEISEGIPVVGQASSHYAVKKVLGEIQDQGARKSTLESLVLKNAVDDMVIPLTPMFSRGVLEYKVSVDDEIARVKVGVGKTFTYADAFYSEEMSLSLGETDVLVDVTSQDGEERKRYKVTVSRSDYQDATLQSLAVKVDGVVQPFSSPFDSAVIDHTVTGPVPHDTESVVFEAVATNSGAVVTLPDGDLVDGFNIKVVMVTSRDGAVVKRYSILVIRSRE